MNFQLPQALKTHMIAHALSSPSNEVCGLLAANAQQVSSIYRVTNVAEKPEKAFLMDAQEQLVALKSIREHGETLCGIYHSHPDSEAIPSQKDLELANYPGSVYLIISLKSLDEPEMKAYLFDGQQFLDMTLIIT